MSCVAFIDTETTGLDPDRHGVPLTCVVAALQAEADARGWR